MKVRNSNLRNCELIGHDKKSYWSDDQGVFDVPSDFGNWLCGTPNWEPADGADLGEVLTSGSLSPEALLDLVDESAPVVDDSAPVVDESAPVVDESAPVVDDESRYDEELERALLSESVIDDDLEPLGVGWVADIQEPSDLDGLTKDELLQVADQYRTNGWDVPKGLSPLKKAEIREILEQSLFESDETEG